MGPGPSRRGTTGQSSKSEKRSEMQNEHASERAVIDYSGSADLCDRNRGGSAFEEPRVVYLDRAAASVYQEFTDDQLYRRARALDVPDRSRLERDGLIAAILKAERSV